MRAITVQDFNPTLRIFVQAPTQEMRQRLVKVRTSFSFLGLKSMFMASLLEEHSPLTFMVPLIGLERHQHPTLNFGGVNLPFPGRDTRSSA